MRPGYEKVLTPEASDFAVELEREFGAERRRLLARRAEVQCRLDAGWKLDFLPETKAIRGSDWRVAPTPHDLQDRRVEITGPTDRKMVINALNSGANVFMADFEDANTPTWDNLVEGQANLMDTVRRTITFDDPQTGRHYALNGETAVLFVRPRGWHLPEAHVLVDGEPMSGALFDFALFFFHNARELVAWGTGPYFYLPNSKVISKRGCGTMSFYTRRRGSDCRKGQSARLYWSRRSSPRSRWTRSSTNCATTRPGSIAAAGITSTVLSRNSPKIRIAYCRIGGKSR
jgi:malate synthase